VWSEGLFALGATTAGLFLWHLSWRHLRQRLAMRRWPRAQAEVLGYRTETSSRSRRVDVRVRYMHEGRVVEAWSRSPTGSAYGRGDVQAERQVATRFPRGSTAEVYVDPAAPEAVFLTLPEPHLIAWLFCGGVLLMALAATMVAPPLLGVGQELVTLIFMLVLAVLLAVMGGFAAVALLLERLRSPRHRRTTRRGTRGPA
jgi:hypothetical protein